MSKPFEEFYVKLAAERFAVAWLENKGFKIAKWDVSSPGSRDIEARSGSARPYLLVQVRTSIQPEDLPSLTSAEEENLKSRAARIEAEAWEARVHLDHSLQLVGKINWRKIFPETSQAQTR